MSRDTDWAEPWFTFGIIAACALAALALGLAPWVMA